MAVQAGRQELEAQLVSQAEGNAAFRQQLLTNPKEAIKQALGITLADNVQVHVVEESNTSYYLVLPPPSGPAGRPPAPWPST